MTLTIKTQDSVASIMDALHEFLPTQYSSSEEVYNCYTIIDEFHANMREHVAPNQNGFKWQLTVGFNNGVIELTFEYGGPYFDPTQARVVESQPIQYRRIGGLGLTLITQLSDKVEYTYNRGVNTLSVEVNTIANSKEDDPCL